MNTQESRDACKRSFDEWCPDFENLKLRAVAWESWKRAWDKGREAALKWPVDVESLRERIFSIVFACRQTAFEDMPNDNWVNSLMELFLSYSVQRDVEEGRLREAFIEGVGAGETTYIPPQNREAEILDMWEHSDARAALLPTELREDKSDV